MPESSSIASSQPDASDCRTAVALLYHELRVEASAYSYVLPRSRFAEHLRLFASLPAASYRPLITFDDGHISNHEHALPMLAQHGIQAHFFITAGWTGKRPGYMEPQHLRDLHAAGHVIGAHGWSHTLLPRCNAAELRHELRGTRAALEDHISAPVTTLSLPGGRSNAAVMAACREAGYTTVWTSLPDTTCLPPAATAGRYNIVAGATDEFLLRLLDPRSGELKRARSVGRIKAAAQRLLGDTAYAKLWAVLNRQESEPEEAAGMANS